MTDSPTPADPGSVDPDVELASAHLDGETGVDERDRAQGGAVAAHVTALSAVADQVRDVPSPPAGLVDAHVARAMAEFDDRATVVPMGRARSSTPWWQRIPLGAVAAALIVVALIGAVSTLDLGTDEDDTATAASDESAEGDSGGTEDTLASAMEDSASIESSPGAGSGGSAERQAFADYEQLAQDLRDELASAPAASDLPDDGDDQGDTAPEATASDQDTAADASGPSDPCGAVAVLGLDPAAVVLVRPAVIPPDQVTAVVHDAADGRRLAVVDDATCSVVLDRLL